VAGTYYLKWSIINKENHDSSFLLCKNKGISIQMTDLDCYRKRSELWTCNPRSDF